MSDHTDLPFKAEYAKSGRASCKACSSVISQDSLRLALMIQSPKFDGKFPNWFHFECFWKRGRPMSEDEIHGFHSLRWEDQLKIKDRIAGKGSGAGDNGCASYADYVAEYAKSNRSTCHVCDEKIEKDSVRVSKKDYESQRSKMFGPMDQWHHVDCFVSNRSELGFSVEHMPERITGFGRLNSEDKDMLMKKLGKGKKRKGGKVTGTGGKTVKKEDSHEDKILKEQSKLIWKYRDALSRHVSKEALQLLLELNGQTVPSGEAKLLAAVSDCLAFGSIDPCPECSGQLVYSPVGYVCTGNITEWTKCMYVTKSPCRMHFEVPSEFHDVTFLKSYKYVNRERVFPTVTIMANVGPVSSSVDVANGNGACKPFTDLKFVFVGRNKKSKSELTKEVEALGGTVVSKPDQQTAACISTKEEIEKFGKGMMAVKKVNIQVVSEDFLVKVKENGSVLELINSLNIAPWGGDVEKRLCTKVLKTAPTHGLSKRDEERFTKSIPSTKKMTVKGGAAVDPESGLQDTAHVIRDSGDHLYTAVLGLVDVARGTNSFYKIQALEGDNKNSYWLYRAWGRIGTNIGGNKVDRCGSQAMAISRFQELYSEKTGNYWDDREHFEKIANKFYPLEVDYGQDEEIVKKLTMSESGSSLPTALQELICLIFDVDQMRRTMLEFEIDMKKMPLGKLSKRQIQSAYRVLTELNQLVEQVGSRTKFVDATNRFYTLIPHDFGMNKIKILDTDESVKAKPMCKDGEMFQRLCRYVSNTHAATHQRYSLEVLDIFEVARDGESQTFDPFRDVTNRQLLWHGSRTTNFVGILSQGLRIAPPEAPVSGYMFGKGIYFADMVSKSANYCCTSKDNPVGILLLCEVALGNMYELTSASYVKKLPKGKQSTKGLGTTVPDPTGAWSSPDGVTIPMGTGIRAPVSTSNLLYNEYIVYDTAQVNVKYLLKTRFNYK